MQKNIQMKDSIFIKPGTVLVGKWNRNRYLVKRKIGTGMIGTVYLCQMHQRLVALKVSKQAMSLTSEVNVLKALNKIQVQDKCLGPFLIDVDDIATKNGEIYSFYAMEYVHGIRLESFVRQRGFEWIGVFILQLLDQLTHLHQAGWILGDLKNDNLLVTTSPPEIRFIDVGGTTRIGRSVKEYSEFYDRAYWQLGSREAEPSYDLFALVMVILAIFYPKPFKRTGDSKQLILQKIAHVPELRMYRPIFQKVIDGRYKSAVEMRSEILKKWMKQPSHKKPKKGTNTFPFAEVIWITIFSGLYYTLFYFIF